MIHAAGFVITRTATDICPIRALSVVRRFGAALPIRIGVGAGTAHEYRLLRIGSALLAARAADAAALGIAILRFVATRAVTYDELSGGATGPG
jgi:hypothetical protein